MAVITIKEMDNFGGNVWFHLAFLVRFAWSCWWVWSKERSEHGGLKCAAGQCFRMPWRALRFGA
jgi:hypothetical protein